MLFNIFGEQNADIMEQFRTLKTGLVHLFQELEQNICASMNTFKNEGKVDVSEVEEGTKLLGNKVEDIVKIVIFFLIFIKSLFQCFDQCVKPVQFIIYQQSN